MNLNRPSSLNVRSVLRAARKRQLLKHHDLSDLSFDPNLERDAEHGHKKKAKRTQLTKQVDFQKKRNEEYFFTVLIGKMANFHTPAAAAPAPQWRAERGARPPQAAAAPPPPAAAPSELDPRVASRERNTP